MTMARATRLLLDRIGSGATVLLSLHLALPDMPAWCDGVDAEGRAVFLVGRHQLGTEAESDTAVAAVLNALAKGYVPEGVCSIAYAPKASAAIAEVVAGESKEVLVDGPRESGKTQLVPGALAILSELHVRAGFPLPLRALWLHDSLKNAAVKTGRSLELPMWQGLWSLRNDRREVVLTIAGVELVVGDFVGTRDETAAERLRAECHVLAAEEIIASLDESGGIEERKYELALTSARLKSRRRVALAVTNPGDVDTWPDLRFIEGGGHPGCIRCAVPAEDRLSAEEVAELRAAFRDSPDLEARLARGEWAALTLGEVVAVGFRGELHVAPDRLEPVAGFPLVLGHDAGLTPVTVIGQAVQGEVRVLVALASDRAGTRQHLEALVQPWLASRAPWATGTGAHLLVHYYDPAMDTPEQANIEQSPVRVLREVLGGATYPGAVSWPGRRDPTLALFNRLNPRTGRAVLQLDSEGCRLLVKALSGRWHYPMVQGRVSREVPAKTHPWSDLGDAFAYFVGGVVPGPVVEVKPITVDSDFDVREIFSPQRGGW